MVILAGKPVGECCLYEPQQSGITPETGGVRAESNTYDLSGIGQDASVPGQYWIPARSLSANIILSEKHKTTALKQTVTSNAIHNTCKVHTVPLCGCCYSII